METSRQELVFLDTKVHLKNGYLIPEIYSKPTDFHEYLNPKSCHPPQVTRNNPYSVALRVRRNCSDRDSDDKMFIDNMVKYKAYLLESGYASDQIDGHFIKVAKLKTDSHEYLNPKSCHPPQVTRNNPYSVALRVRRNCSDRDSDDKMFIDNIVKYKAYLLESGYASDQIDGHFIKVAKLKRKDAMSNDGCRKRGSSVKKKKINFVTT